MNVHDTVAYKFIYMQYMHNAYNFSQQSKTMDVRHRTHIPHDI